MHPQKPIPRAQLDGVVEAKDDIIAEVVAAKREVETANGVAE
jgi:hypothetical protein